MKTIRQHDRNDCGAACLAAIAGYYGRAVSVAQVRLLLGTDAEGSTLGELHDAALRMGFQAVAVSGDYAGLRRASLPAIVHLDHADTGQHFVVLCRAGRRRVVVMDPAEGRRRRWHRDAFCRYWSGTALLLLPGATFEQAEAPPGTWRQFARLLYPVRRAVFTAIACSVAATLLAMAGALFVQLLADRILPAGSGYALHRLGAVFAFLLLVQATARLGQRLLTLHTGRLLDARLLRSYCHHLLRLPIRFVQQWPTGELLSRMGDAVKIRQLVNDGLIQLTIPLILLLGTLLLLATAQPRLGIVLLIVVPLHVAIYLIGHALHRGIQRRLMAADAALDSQFTETFQAIGTVRQLGLERHHGHRLDAGIARLLHENHASGRATVLTDEATHLLVQAFSLFLLWAGGSLVLQGGITLGALLAYYTLSGYFSTALTQLMPLARHVQEARIAADRLYSLMALPPDEKPGATLLHPSEALPIRVNDVHFAYRPGQPVLQGVSLTIPAGSITAVTGRSGSGKSTLLALLLKEHPLASGSIHLGGNALALVSREALHRLIAVVPQHTELFQGTVAENCCPGTGQPDSERLASLCRELGLMPWIESLPHGFDAHIGPNGCRLSGGQRQRLALVRALYRQPQVLLLDEATSALDAEAEGYVHRALRRLRDAGMAIVVVSHRESTLTLADRVIHLEDGRMVSPVPGGPANGARGSAGHGPAPQEASDV